MSDLYDILQRAMKAADGEHAVTHWHRIGEGYAQRRQV